MSTPERRHFTPAAKVAILRKHLLEDKPVSEVCAEAGIAVTQFYTWQKVFFEQGTAAFESTRSKSAADDAKVRKIAAPGREAPTQARGALRADGGARRVKKRTWEALKGEWVSPDVRDAVVDFMKAWTTKAGRTARRLLGWVGLAASKYHAWFDRYGKVNEHNGPVPRDHWLTADEKKAIVDFHREHPLEGDRRFTYLMIDRDVVAWAPASVYRVLSQAGLLKRWNYKANSKGTGFVLTRSTPRTRARRRVVSEPGRDLLLPVLGPRRGQSGHRPQGDS